MPGLCGVFSPAAAGEPAATLAAMTALMTHGEGYTVQTVLRAGLGLAAVDLRPEFSHTAYQADGLIVMCYGYVFFRGDDRRHSAFGDPEVCQRIAALYRRHGRQFPCQLDGKFQVALVDQAQDLVLVVNDRHAAAPLYYAEHSTGLLVAAEAKALLQAGRDPVLDPIGLQEFLLFDYPLNSRTLFAGITHVPNGTVLSHQGGATRLERYWDYTRALGDEAGSSNRQLSKEQVERVEGLLQQAIDRAVNPAMRTLYPLSGGLDSRFVAFYAQRAGAAPVTTVSYGEADSRELRYAARYAKALGVPNLPFPHQPKMFREHGADFAWRTDGMCGIQHSHAVPYLSALCGQYHYQLNGYLGDLVAGSHLDEHPPEISADEQTDRLVHESLSFRAVSPRLYRGYFSTFDWDAIRHDVYAVVTRGRQQIGPKRACQYFFWTQRGCRGVAVIMYGGTTWLEHVYPFLDADYFDFMMALPRALRLNQVLYRALLDRHPEHLRRLPFVAAGTWGDRGALPDVVARAAGRVEKCGKYFIEAASLGRLHWRLSSTQHRYDRWLRRDLRDWKNQLLDAFSRRGLLDAPFLRRVARYQQVGLDRPYLFVYNAMTLELFLQALASRSPNVAGATRRGPPARAIDAGQAAR
jgi:asparagine synthetase B (glutamine-hydrolysing)